MSNHYALKHTIEAYVLGTFSLHSLIYSIKKSSRTISILFANSFSFILDQTVNPPFSPLAQVQDSFHFPRLYEKVLN